MTGIRGLNHVTFAVTDLERSVAFYTVGLGMTLARRWETGAYLEAGPLWLCLSCDEAGRREPHPDYTHVAFDVSQEDFQAATTRVKAVGGRAWRDNKSEGDSFYFLDPDGHKLELHVGTLESRLAAVDECGKSRG